MKRIALVAAFLLPILSLASHQSVSASTKAGAICTKLGTISKSGSQTFTCKKSGKKLIWVLTKVATSAPKPSPTQAVSVESTPTPTPSPTLQLPPVVGPDPSQKVIAFYYAWYGNPKVDGQWIHWNDTRLGANPPDDIPSDYFPQLGAYSSNDPAVVAQHMAWLRQAGVGVIAVSWWRIAPTDDQMKLIFDMAQRYGIKVTFHLEPAGGRDSTSIVSDVVHLVNTFGNHPAFFRTTVGSPYLKAGEPHPMFFEWSTVVPATGQDFVPSSYWAAANDQIHSQTNSLMIGTPTTGGYANTITDGHFDGAYNYISLHLDTEGGFDWAKSMPRGSLYIPSVAPGNSGIRIKYPDNTLMLRNDGATYDTQWTTALGTGVVPPFVTITSFNEWHEGSEIEPATPNYVSASGRKYLDFGSLAPTAYLDRTRTWVDKFVANDFPVPTTSDVKIEISTSSDWETLDVTAGQLIAPLLLNQSGDAQVSSFNGSRFTFNQDLKNAQQGKSLNLSYEMNAIGSTLSFKNSSGYIGSTTVKISIKDGDNWKLLKTLTWIGGPGDDGKVQSVALQ